MIDPDDLYLWTIELLIIVGLLVSVYFAIKVKSKYKYLTEHGWNTIVYGMIFILFHAIFDALDTLEWTDDVITDMLNVLDGGTFVIGLCIVAFGIWKIAQYGDEIWGSK